MSSIAAAGYRVDLSTVKRLMDVPGLKVGKLSNEQIAEMEQVFKDQFRIPAGPADNDASNLFAEVKVNGKTVAKLYNSGCAETPNSVYGQVADLPSMGASASAVGPQLAAQRAKEIAEKLGGTVVTASTAQTQSQWQNRAPVTFTYDYAALDRAMQARAASMQTLIDAQTIGQAA